MTPSATSVPSPGDILCEACGYTLNGLPAEGNCPECGTPVAFSTTQSRRTSPAWETGRRFWVTTWQVILQTSHFYRTLKTRVEVEQQRAAYRFALRHWFLAGLLVAIASGLHYSLTDPPARPGGVEQRLFLVGLWVALVTIIAGFAMMGITHLASWLTAWEARWRGLRLPHGVVLRGLCYHSAQLLPVATTLLLLVVANRLLWALGYVSYENLVAYLIILSGAAVLGAVFLFWTYWIGMRNMLFANE